MEGETAAAGRPRIKIIPSILASDFAALGEECARMEAAGADGLHVDVMDGHFVPNLSVGPDVVRSLRPHVRVPLDIHLMVTDPASCSDAFRAAGADFLTFHAETLSGMRTDSEIRAMAARIRRGGAKAGLVLNPGTPAEAAFAFLAEIDMLVVMTVEPGFGGQELIESALHKVKKARDEARRVGRDGLDIEVDGGIRAGNAARAVSAGANVLVAGNALFSAPDYAAAVREMRKEAMRGAAGRGTGAAPF